MQYFFLYIFNFSFLIKVRNAIFVSTSCFRFLKTWFRVVSQNIFIFKLAFLKLCLSTVRLEPRKFWPGPPFLVINSALIAKFQPYVLSCWDNNGGIFQANISGWLYYCLTPIISWKHTLNTESTKYPLNSSVLAFYGDQIFKNIWQILNSDKNFSSFVIIPKEPTKKNCLKSIPARRVPLKSRLGEVETLITTNFS